MFANQRPIIVTQFDNSRPRGSQGQARGLVREIWTRVQGFRTHPYGPEKADPSITFNGVAAPAQDFRGWSAANAGGSAYRDGGSATIESGLVEGPMGDPARRIFAARLKRQSSLGGM